MKKITLLTLLLVSIEALATKARDTALGRHFNSNDPQGIYANSGYVFNHKNLISLESGVTAATSTTNNAEGLVYLDKMAFSFGAINNLVQSSRKFMNSIVGANTYEAPQNPLHFWYGIELGQAQLALAAFYSNKKDKVANTSETTSGLGFSYKIGDYGIRADFVPTNEVEAAGNLKFNAAGTYKIMGRYNNSGWNYGIDFTNEPIKSTNAGTDTESYNNQIILLRALKKYVYDGATIYTTTALQLQTLECKVKGSASCSTKFTRTNLPFTLGIEADASEWFVVRGSMSQNIFDSSKDDIGLPTAANSGVTGATGAVSEFGAAPNSTAINLGVGLRFNNLTIDGTVSTATTQIINSSSLISQVGVAYKF